MSICGEPFARLLVALESHGCRPRVIGERGRAKCPAHDDRVASLIFGTHDGGVRLKCFVCGWKPVVAALGLQPSDLYNTPRPSLAASDQQIVAQYPYIFDTDGESLAERVRFGPVKSFAWRSRQPGGRWRFGLHGASVGLYRADSLIDQRLVLVLEGEKAVEAAVALGYTATCGPHGAAKWTAAFTETLWRSGAHLVVVLGDCDVPGRRFAERVAASCSGFRPSLDPPLAERAEPWTSWPSAEPDDEDVQPLRVKLLPLPNLPVHGDLFDWVHAGGTPSSLADLIANTPDWSPPSPDAKIQRTRQQTRVRVAAFRASDKTAPGHCYTSSVPCRPISDPPITQSPKSGDSILPGIRQRLRGAHCPPRTGWPTRHAARGEVLESSGVHLILSARGAARAAATCLARGSTLPWQRCTQARFRSLCGSSTGTTPLVAEPNCDE